MSIMYLLIGCSLTLAIFFLGAFIWSVKSGQYDDAVTPSIRMLLDNPTENNNKNNSNNQSNQSTSK